MNDVMIAAVLLVIIGAAAWYIVRSRKKGRRCIGCPGGCCSGQCASCSSCEETPEA